ncbi:MAG: histidine--tRNA ligase [Chitinophagaceae bacterium]
MAKVNVGLPQGTRDFSATVVRKRQYILHTIQHVFELYGFTPLETPAMENLETLMGKYGDEGDKLIFKILNNGLDNVLKHEKIKEDFEIVLSGKNAKGITERALRYDLTIPFARYVAMNYGQLAMPFKRYQIQPVWRADRPQKGRYREFYQCDADVVGSNSLLNEVELINIYATVFKKLGIPVEIKINSRKILAALASVCENAENLTAITVAIDKLDKIGIDKVKEELATNGLSEGQIIIIEKYLSIKGSNTEKIALIQELLGENEIGKKGIAELEYVMQFNSKEASKEMMVVDFTLARGLNYYTGIIFEIKAKNVQMGSIGGGGRYDDLTSLFGVPNVPGVGISFGVDRIYDVIEELQLFPETVHVGTTALFFNLGFEESKVAFEWMQLLRLQNTSCELFHEPTKLDKQFKYAEKKQIPFVIIIGSKELEEKTCIIKNVISGEQNTFTKEQLLNFSFS